MTNQSTPETRLASRRALFWDIGPARISSVLHENDHWAVMRIFDYGSIDDILDCIQFYGRKKVVAILTSSKLGRVAYVMAYFALGFDPDGRYR